MHIVGSEVEVYGTVGSFLVADICPKGEIIFTVRVTESNALLILARAEDAGSEAVQLSKTIVQVPAIACVARYQGNSLQSDGYLQTSMSDSLVQLQRVLARRMRFSA